MVTVFLISATLIPSTKPGQLHNCRTWKWQFYLFCFCQSCSRFAGSINLRGYD